MRQYFDDGSWLDYDAAGNVVGGADINGAAISAPSSSVGAHVVNLLSLGVRSFVDNANADRAAARQIQLQRAGIIAPGNGAAAIASLMPLLLLGAAAFFAFKLIKG